jgi:hypothetical protein
MIRRLLDGDLYPHGLKVEHCEGYPPHVDGCILIVPGRYWAEAIPDIEDAISSFRWVLFIRTSDEQDLFDVNQVAGPPNIKFWVQTPRTDRNYGDARLFGVGFPPPFNYVDANVPTKTADVFLSAQNTHPRRYAAFQALKDHEGVSPTTGFTRGLPAPAYVAHMTAAKVAPAPSGIFSPDTFRVWEALEAHSVPIADDISPAYESAGFWKKLLPAAPFPTYTDAADLPEIIDQVLEDWPANANQIAAWWCRQKRRYAHWLVEDLTALGAL